MKAHPDKKAELYSGYTIIERRGNDLVGRPYHEVYKCWLQPMAQAIMADVFPPKQRGVAFALYGITTIIAPTIGPTYNAECDQAD